MAEKRKTPKQDEIRLYLLRLIATQSSLNPRRISETALARQFRTTRPTLHAVCESLEAIEYLIRLPGRHGLFTNPDYCRENIFYGLNCGVIFGQGDHTLAGDYNFDVL